MVSRLKSSAAGLILLCLAACAGIDHNIPKHAPISGAAPPGTITLFADANGYLYPDDWRARFDARDIERSHSLLASKNFDRQVRDELVAERDRQLDEAARSLATRSRVFVLVHGFNNTQDQARRAFNRLRQLLPLRPDDGVVEFHWDGLTSPGLIGRGVMWFKAVGYSQLAGTQALRELIRRLPDKEIVIVAHSRGASVTLSALSDPAYDPDFVRETASLSGVSLYSDPLPPDGAPIRAVFLAPAIGYPDFWRRDGGNGRDCEPFRSFPNRLRRIDYTVNPQDPVLDKPLVRPSTFNATDLGFDPVVGQLLRRCYAGRVEIVAHDLNMPAHPFLEYLREENEELVGRMLAGTDPPRR